MSYPPLQTLLNSLREEPNTPGVLENTIDALVANRDVEEDEKEGLRAAKLVLRNAATAQETVRASVVRSVQEYLVTLLEEMTGPPLRRSLAVEIPPPPDFNQGGRRRKSQTKRFGSCVKAVRKTVKARKGSTAEGAAIAICTTTLLHPRGRTIKRYRKGRLLTQTRK